VAAVAVVVVVVRGVRSAGKAFPKDLAMPRPQQCGLGRLEFKSGFTHEAALPIIAALGGGRLEFRSMEAVPSSFAPLS
jgi:hypothetical protein